MEGLRGANQKEGRDVRSSRPVTSEPKLGVSSEFGSRILMKTRWRNKASAIPFAPQPE